jgi:hypothetical protein
MVHGGGNRLRSIAERFRRLEALGAQPDSSGSGLGQGSGFSRAGQRAAM